MQSESLSVNDREFLPLIRICSHSTRSLVDSAIPRSLQRGNERFTLSQTLSSRLYSLALWGWFFDGLLTINQSNNAKDGVYLLKFFS
jgi:hypothetical protein